MFQPVAGRISFLKEEFTGKGIFEEISGNGIESVGPPGMATGNTPCGKPAAQQWAMKFQCVDGIDGTGGEMSASTRQQW